MFDLEEAIAEWRESAAPYVPSSDLEELEIHLRDGIEARVDDGAKVDDAFVLATHQLGDVRDVGLELIRESGEVPPSMPRARRVRSRWQTALMAMGCCVFLLFLVECFWVYTEETYESQVAFELKPLRLGSNVPIFDNKSAVRPDEKVDVTTEMEIVRSRKTLYDTLDTLKLDERWQVTRPRALERVRKGVTLNRLGDSQVLQLSYTGEKAQLVANIANGIVNSYRQRKIKLWSNRHNNWLDTLQRQLKDQSDKVEEARLRMLDLAERYRISPELFALRTEAEMKMFGATQDAEISLARGEGEELRLRTELTNLKDLYQTTLDETMDSRRMLAEYEESNSDYDLQTQMLRNMQETFAKTQVILTMPLTPIVYHEDAEVAIEKRVVDWPQLWANLFRHSWPGILLAGGLGWWFGNRRVDLQRPRVMISPIPLSTTKGGKKDADDEISWA
jgi:hypothetical protein